MRSGDPIPDAILNAPLLPRYLEFFYDAFNRLSTCRQIGMAEGPIPITAILEYGRFYDCDHTLLDDLIYHVMKLDEVYFEHQKRQSKMKS